MPSVPAVSEQRFVLEHVVGLTNLGVDADITNAVLEGVGQFAAGELAPLLRTGDIAGPKWTEHGAKMPADFIAA